MKQAVHDPEHLCNIRADTCYMSWKTVFCTVEPLNKGHIGTALFVLVRRLSSLRGLKCIRTIERAYFGTASLGLCREVYYRKCVRTFGRVHCILVCTAFTAVWDNHCPQFTHYNQGGHQRKK